MVKIIISNVISLCKAFISDIFEYKWQSSRNVTTMLGTFGVKVKRQEQFSHKCICGKV